jgi:signal transduction histidine kinase/ligand-binding sensor domain-containing protein
VSKLTELASSPAGTIWVARNGCLSELEHGKLTVVPFPADPDFDFIHGIGASSDGGLWVAGASVLRKWKDHRWLEESHPLRIRGVPIHQWIEMRSGVLAAATAEEGLLLWSPLSNRPGCQLCRTNGFPSDWITTLYEDREGTLWIGTGGAGLFAARPGQVQNVAPPDLWQGRDILSVTSGREGSLWVGTEGAGVYQLRNGNWRNLGRAEGLINPYVWSLAEEPAGRFWAGSWDAGVFLLNSNRWVTAPGLAEVDSPVRAMLPARGGGLWLGTGQGLLRYQDGQATWFGRDGKPEVRNVTCVLEAADDTVWFGTLEQGLGRLRQGQVQLFRRTDGLGGDSVECLHLDPDGVLWIGTDGGGLTRLENNTFATISEEQGLADSTICHVEEDGAGSFWMSSHHGIMRVSKQDLTRCAKEEISTVGCLSFGLSEGLPTVECTGQLQPSGCQGPDGRLWFATTHGVVAIDPAKVTTNPLPPLVVVESLLVDDRQMIADRALQAPLDIPPGRHRFEFHYTGLSFVAPERVRFKYRLNGLESDWINANTRRTANFSYLPPGPYRFEVMACNNDGVWNETGAAVAFAVLPFFWQTLWFRLGTIFFIAGLGGGGVWFEGRRRMHRRLERLERQHAVENERARIARDIHDDLGAQLTHITMLSELAQGEIHNPARLTAFLQRSYNTGRELTRSMDEIVWAVNPRHDTLESLPNYLEAYTNDLLGTAGMSCRFDFPPQYPAWTLSSEVRHNVFLAYKEALTNLVKHARATEVRIAMSLSETGFELRIEDNGAGFCFEAEKPESDLTGPPAGSGNGLHNMARRLRNLGGRFSLQSAPGQGTRITFQVPVPASNRPAR